MDTKLMLMFSEIIINTLLNIKSYSKSIGINHQIIIEFFFFKNFIILIYNNLYFMSFKSPVPEIIDGCIRFCGNKHFTRIDRDFVSRKCSDDWDEVSREPREGFAFVEYERRA